ncbi:hypothetical protein SDC9_159198 [bioreactor metagenome]|uniref:Uncharacterized protein n=1 Tax=bioreactor metagenome TaxID=1076179 RepID=A0A645FEW3_9ZZZZ
MFLLFMRYGNQTDHSYTAVLQNDGGSQKSLLATVIFAIAAFTERVKAGMRHNLFFFTFQYIAQQSGVTAQRASEVFPVSAGSRDAAEVIIDDLNFELQNAGKHSGETLNGRLNLHQNGPRCCKHHSLTFRNHLND